MQYGLFYHVNDVSVYLYTLQNYLVKMTMSEDRLLQFQGSLNRWFKNQKHNYHPSTPSQCIKLQRASRDTCLLANIYASIWHAGYQNWIIASRCMHTRTDIGWLAAVAFPDPGKPGHCLGKILVNCGYCLWQLGCDIADLPCVSPAQVTTNGLLTSAYANSSLKLDGIWDGWWMVGIRVIILTTCSMNPETAATMHLRSF